MILDDHNGKVIKILTHWFVKPLVVYIRSTCMSSESYSEGIFSLSDVLDGTFPAFNAVNYIPGVTISYCFHSKPLTSCGVVDRNASSNICTHFVAWLMALAISLVSFLGRFQHCSYQKVPEVMGAVVSNKGGFGSTLFSQEDTWSMFW